MRRSAILLSLALAGTFPLSACGGEDEPKSLVFYDCKSGKVEPTTIKTGCGNSRFSFEKLSYDAWTDRYATGMGRVSAPSCDPDCGTGAFNTYPAEFYFFRPVKCDDGKTYFSRVSLTYTDKSWTGEDVDVFEIAPIRDDLSNGSLDFACKML